jgi:hypothetical protein
MTDRHSIYELRFVTPRSVTRVWISSCWLPLAGASRLCQSKCFYAIAQRPMRAHKPPKQLVQGLNGAGLFISDLSPSPWGRGYWPVSLEGRSTLMTMTSFVLEANHDSQSAIRAQARSLEVSNRRADSFSARVAEAPRASTWIVRSRYLTDYAAEMAQREHIHKLTTGNKASTCCGKRSGRGIDVLARVRTRRAPPGQHFS